MQYVWLCTVRKYQYQKSISVTYLRKWAWRSSSSSSSVFETYISLHSKCARITSTQDCRSELSLLINCSIMQQQHRLWSYILTHHKHHPKKSNLFRISIQQFVQSGKWISSVGHKCLYASWELGTELTSPAIKSFMTLQCCGPHSARPASTNLCLRSNGKHTHTTGLTVLSLALKSASADSNYKCSSKQAHTFTNTQSVFICVSLPLLRTPVSSATPSGNINL